MLGADGAEVPVGVVEVTSARTGVAVGWTAVRRWRVAMAAPLGWVYALAEVLTAAVVVVEAMSALLSDGFG